MHDSLMSIFVDTKNAIYKIKNVNREDLKVYTCEMPTGNKGYYLGNKEGTKRYTYKTMFLDDLKFCELFKEGVDII